MNYQNKKNKWLTSNTSKNWVTTIYPPNHKNSFTYHFWAQLQNKIDKKILKPKQLNLFNIKGGGSL